MLGQSIKSFVKSAATTNAATFLSANSKVLSLEREKFIQSVFDHKVNMKKLEYKLSYKARLSKDEKVVVEKKLEALKKAMSTNHFDVRIA